MKASAYSFRCQSQGHTQQEHETSHGSMTQTRWAIEGPDGIGVELRGRKFAANDEGTPMMCNLVCSSMGRHVHIDNCRTAEGTPCSGTEIQHLNARMIPDPDKSKDAVTHRLYWHRMGTLHTIVRDPPKTEIFPQASKVANLYLSRTDAY